MKTVKTQRRDEQCGMVQGRTSLGGGRGHILNLKEIGELRGKQQRGGGRRSSQGGERRTRGKGVQRAKQRKRFSEKEGKTPHIASSCGDGQAPTTRTIGRSL